MTISNRIVNLQSDQSPTAGNALPDIVTRLRCVPPFSHLTAAQVASLLPAPAVNHALAGAVLTAVDDATRDYLVLFKVKSIRLNVETHAIELIPHR